MMRLVHALSRTSAAAAAPARSKHASPCAEPRVKMVAGSRPLSFTAAPWTLAAGAAAVCRAASVCTPPEHQQQCMDWSLAPAADDIAAAEPCFHEPPCPALTTPPSLDLELTAEEAQFLVQPPTLTIALALAPVAARKRASPRPLLRRAATSMYVTSRRLAWSASSGARRLRASLAAASCLSRPAVAADEPFTPRGPAWTHTHVNWSC